MDTTPPSAPIRTGLTDFTLPAPPIDTLLFCFDALITMNEPTDTQDFKTILSPRKPKVKPGPRKQPLPSIPYKFAKPVATPSRQKKAFTTEFKLGVLAWWEHARIEDSDGSERPPNRLEVCTRYGLKHVRYLNRWKNDMETFYS